MSDEIKIKAEPLDETVCRFTVDRPLYQNGSFYFGSPSLAVQSPLGQKLFDIDGVSEVLVQDAAVTITAAGNVDWRQVGPQVGAALRAFIATGEPAIPESMLSDLPGSDEIKGQVDKILQEQINPAIASHGGFVELIDVKSNEIFIRLGGGCQGCGAASMTLKYGIEKAIREQVPGVGAIMDTTDHAAGRNPYYAPSK